MRMVAFFLWIGFVGNLMAPPTPSNQDQPDEHRSARPQGAPLSFTEEHLNKKVAPTLEFAFVQKSLDEISIVHTHLKDTQQRIHTAIALLNDPGATLHHQKIMVRLEKAMSKMKKDVDQMVSFVNARRDGLTQYLILPPPVINLENLNKRATIYAETAVEYNLLGKQVEPDLDAIEPLIERYVELDTKDLSAETPVFNVPFYPQSPNYDTLTTVVRLTHYGDMMVDTRDHQGRYAWFAIVFFENQEGRFPSDWHSIEPPFPSRVRVKLFRAPGYGDEDRTYGDVAFGPSDDEAGAPLTSSSFCLEEPDIMWHGKEECADPRIKAPIAYRDNLKLSHLEWALPAPLTIHHFFHELNGMRLDDHTFPGFIPCDRFPEPRALHQTTFTLAFLRRFLPIEEIGPFPEEYFPDYQQPTSLWSRAVHRAGRLYDALAEREGPAIPRLLRMLELRYLAGPLDVGPRFVLTRNQRDKDFESIHAFSILDDHYRRKPFVFAYKNGRERFIPSKAIVKYFPSVAYRLLEEPGS
ncbi:hypothetical protein EIL50_04125 [bacterium NHP-B]|nr:hypothetical protein EIL50_04125 [bacterium NHP-B]